MTLCSVAAAGMEVTFSPNKTKILKNLFVVKDYFLGVHLLISVSLCFIEETTDISS